MGVIERLKTVKEQFCELAKQDPYLEGIDVDKFVTVQQPVHQKYSKDGSAWYPYLHHQTALRVENAKEDTVKLQSKILEFIYSYEGMMAVRKALNPFLDSSSKYTATTLLEIGAVQLNVKKPFKYKSGKRGPIYVDNRFLVTQSKHKGAIASFMAEMMDNEVYSDIHMICGGETAGMAPAERLAQLIDLPYFYVRKERKEHGKKNVVIGDPEKINPPALLVEDLVTFGDSKLIFIDNMRDEKAYGNVVFVIFDRQQGGREKVLTKSCELYSITDFVQTTKVAGEKGYLSEEEVDVIMDYIKDPEKWERAHT